MAGLGATLRLQWGHVGPAIGAGPTVVIRYQEGHKKIDNTGVIVLRPSQDTRLEEAVDSAGAGAEGTGNREGSGKTVWGRAPGLK